MIPMVRRHHAESRSMRVPRPLGDEQRRCQVSPPAGRAIDPDIAVLSESRDGLASAASAIADLPRRRQCTRRHVWLRCRLAAVRRRAEHRGAGRGAGSPVGRRGAAHAGQLGDPPGELPARRPLARRRGVVRAERRVRGVVAVLTGVGGYRYRRQEHLRERRLDAYSEVLADRATLRGYGLQRAAPSAHDVVVSAAPPGRQAASMSCGSPDRLAQLDDVGHRGIARARVLALALRQWRNAERNHDLRLRQHDLRRQDFAGDAAAALKPYDVRRERRRTTCNHSSPPPVIPVARSPARR